MYTAAHAAPVATNLVFGAIALLTNLLFAGGRCRAAGDAMEGTAMSATAATSLELRGLDKRFRAHGGWTMWSRSATWTAEAADASADASAATSAARRSSTPTPTSPTRSSPSAAQSARHGPPTDGTPGPRIDDDHHRADVRGGWRRLARERRVYELVPDSSRMAGRSKPRKVSGVRKAVISWICAPCRVSTSMARSMKVCVLPFQA